MSKITELKRGKGREKRINVYLDGTFSFSLLAETALKKALKTGQELSESEIEELKRNDRYQRCFNKALRYLGYRPRSEAEIRQRLQRYGYDNECTERAIVRLKEQGLIDDMEFARFWIENRENFRPRSRWLIGVELQRKGLDRRVIEEATGGIDDSESAYRAAVNKANRLANTEYDDFRRRLGEYLRRRGFSYDVINITVEKVLREGSFNI